MYKNEGQTSARHKTLTIIGIILSIILIPIIILNLTLIVMNFVGGEDNLPNIGGYFPLAVKSGSMSGAIEVGDLILIKSVDDVDKLAKGDVITFWDKEPGTSIVTHRITEVTKDQSGNLAFSTKGDANVVEDFAAVPAKNVIGVFNSRVPHLGDIVMFMQTPQGMLLCVGVPLVLLIAYDMLRRRKFQKAETREKDALIAELDRLKSGQDSDDNNILSI